MESKKIIGLVICVLLFASGFAFSRNIGAYFNIAALLVVVGGTLGAAFLSFRTESLVKVLRVVRHSCCNQPKNPAEIVEILVDLSVKSRIRGLRSLSEDEGETSIMFLRRGLGFLVDNYSRAQIEDILSTEVTFFKHRRDASERVLRTMAQICPAFGLVGSIIGLIGMLAGVGETSVILATIPIALTSTLYGVVFANFLFLPFAASIRERTDHELLLQKIILEGILAIQEEVNPRILEMKLKSFLPPAEREGRIVSLQRIQERFKIQPEAGAQTLPKTASGRG